LGTGSHEEKEKRVEVIMRLQEEFLSNAISAMIGMRNRILIEGTGDGISVGRSYRDAPEIDGSGDH
jgi:ribosomal protein S12 methylthiotransferase